MSARKSSHRTIFLIVSSGSPLALIASSLRSTSKKPVYPMTRSLHPPMAHCGQRVRFAATWREEFFEVPCRHSASHVDRRHRIQLVIKGGCQSICITGQPNSRRSAGTNVPAGTPLLVSRCSRAKRASHIDPPASSYAIMQRACPYCGENPGPGKDVEGELEPRPGIREQPRPQAEE